MNGTIKTRADYINAFLSICEKRMIAEAVMQGIRSYNSDKKNGKVGYNSQGFHVASAVLWKAFYCMEVDCLEVMKEIAEKTNLDGWCNSLNEYFDEFVKRMILRITNLRVRDFD